MTCKDCIHYEACHDMYYEEHATRHFDPEKHNAEKECGYFKDRSRFVELPCKIGSELYRIKKINGRPFVTNTRLNVNNFWKIVIQGEFGKTVFLTREEAEQALKERE